MNWESLINPEIQRFIEDNDQADVAALGLKKAPHGWNYPLVLDQIKARQKARLKMPGWLETPGLLFPAPSLVEQASSQACALYKASLVHGERFLDLTAGMGVDSFALAEKFCHGVCIDSQPQNASLLAHNASIWEIKNLDIFCARAEDFLQTAPASDLIFIDPQRRDKARKARFLLEETRPNIVELLDLLRQKTRWMMLKASPMLDIAQACLVLENVHAVHVVEWRGECREVLYILDFTASLHNEYLITATAIDDLGQSLSSLTFTQAEEKTAAVRFSEPLRYLYEPSPAFLKAGGFRTMARRYGIHKLHPHTHLYTSNNLTAEFPGRRFQILDVLSAHDKDRLPARASISARNYPEKAENLYRKLKIKEGGIETLFACTLNKERHALIRCQKI